MSQNSTKPDVELVYPEPIELLDESEHHNNIDIVKFANSLAKEINSLKSHGS